MYKDLRDIEWLLEDINNTADYDNNPHIIVWLADSGYRIDAVNCDGDTIDTLAAGLDFVHMYMIIKAFHNYAIL